MRIASRDELLVVSFVNDSSSYIGGGDMNYKKAFIGFIVIVLISGCTGLRLPGAPDPQPTKFVPVMQMFDSTPAPGDNSTGSTAAISGTAPLSGTVSPASTPVVTTTESSSRTTPVDVNTMFADFAVLCEKVTAMTDAQQSAFAQQYKARPIGPWRGRAKEVVPKAAVGFVMNKPDFNAAAGTSLVVSLVNAQKDYVANKVYDFYGTLISASGTSTKDCQVILQADDREGQNTIVGP